MTEFAKLKQGICSRKLRLWCWEGLGAGGKGEDRGWDGWMASLTRWIWISVNSRRWWWTGRAGVLRFMGLQRVKHIWVTELNWTEQEQLWSGIVWSLPLICQGLGWHDLKSDLSQDCWPETMHGFLCALGFLIALRLQGSQTSYLKDESSKAECSGEHSGG